MNARRITIFASIACGVAAGVCVLVAASSDAQQRVHMSKRELARVHARAAFTKRYAADAQRVPTTHATGVVPTCTSTRNVAGQGASCRLRDGSFAMAAAPGAITHGPDLLSLTSSNSNARVRRPGSAADLVCSSTSRSHHVLLVYLLPRDFATGGHGDRFAQVAPQMRDALATASGIVADRSAQLQPGSRRRIRVACDASGAPVVARVVLPRTAAQYRASTGGFSAIIADLDRAGVLEQYPDYESRASRELRRVVGYYDADFLPGVAGQGTLYRRSTLLNQGVSARSPLVSQSVRNINNDPPQSSVAVAYGTSVDGTPEPPRATSLLHEMTHTMGAVQNEVPTTSGAGHCIDGLDVMCYDDGGPFAASYTPTACPGDPTAGPSDDQLQYDCNGDTYFNPAPALGTPLAGGTVWNLALAANQTLTSATADHPVLGAIRTVKVTGRGTALLAKWTAAAGAKAYDVTAIPVNGSVPPTQAAVVGRSARLQLAPATAYSIVVTALDASAAAGPATVVTRTTGADTTPPSRVAPAHWLAKRRGQLRMVWPAGQDNVAVVAYIVERVVARRWVRVAVVRAVRGASSLTTPWLRVPAGSTQSLHVIALDRRGNRSLPSRVLRVAIP